MKQSLVRLAVAFGAVALCVLGVVQLQRSFLNPAAAQAPRFAPGSTAQATPLPAGGAFRDPFSDPASSPAAAPSTAARPATSAPSATAAPATATSPSWPTTTIRPVAAAEADSRAPTTPASPYSDAAPYSDTAPYSSSAPRGSASTTTSKPRNPWDREPAPAAAEDAAGPPAFAPGSTAKPLASFAEPTPAAAEATVDPNASDRPGPPPPAATVWGGNPTVATGDETAAAPASKPMATSPRSGSRPAVASPYAEPAPFDPGTTGAEPAMPVRTPVAAGSAFGVTEPTPAETAPAVDPAERAPATVRFATPSSTSAATAGPGLPSEGGGQPGEKELEGPQSAQLVIEKKAPKEMQVGQPAAIEIVVRNTGTRRAEHVEVRDEVPRGAQLIDSAPQATAEPRGTLLWKLGTLEPGDETIVRLQVMPLSEGEIGSVATVTSSAHASARSIVTRPRLGVVVNAPRQVLIDEDVKLKIKVSNTGSGVARGVMLRETIPAGLRHPAGEELEYEIGDMQPGDIKELELSLRAVQPGRLINEILAYGAGNLEAEPAKSEIEVVAPALEVAADGPKKRFLERQAVYTISVSNPGTAAAQQVALVATLPEGMEFVRADAAGRYDAKTRRVQWLLEELPPNHSGSVTLATMPVQTGAQTVIVEASAPRGLTARQEQQTMVEGVAAVLFQVVDVEDPVEVGGETVYEIRVINQGSKTSTNLRIAAELPPEMKLISADGETRHAIHGPQIIFDPVQSLAPKADIRFRLKVKCTAAGDMRFRCQLLTDDMESPVLKEESTRVYADE